MWVVFHSTALGMFKRLASGIQIAAVGFLGFKLDAVYLTVSPKFSRRLAETDKQTFLLVAGCLFLYEQVLCGERSSDATTHQSTDLEDIYVDFQICLLGSQCVGKTRLIERAVGTLENGVSTYDCK